MSRHRSWTITVNNHTEQDEQQLQLQQQRALFIVYGREKGESGTPHLQGYIQMKQSQTLEYMKKHVHATAHFEVARGTPLQNYNYCTKDGDFWIFGEVPKQGKRTDIEKIKQMVSEGATMKEIANEATSYQSAKFGELLLKYNEPKRNQEIKVYWFYGPPGSGKTREAAAMCPEAYWHNGTKWFDGYDGEKEVIMDDFRQEGWTIESLLRMWQPYPYRVETKGSTRQLQATTFIITTPYSVDNLFFIGEDIQQLKRRINVIREFINKETIVTGEPVRARPDKSTLIE